MNHISHKQAIQWINRRLDNLLTDEQALLLDEHLNSCASCRRYAERMESLRVRLQGEFRARWDEKSDLSQNVRQHVAAKARNIPAANRLSSGIRWFAGAAALVLLGVALNFVISQWRTTFRPAAEPATGPEAAIGLLAFASNQNQTANYDIYIMHADGSERTNLTNNPAHDDSPFWSPNGKQIAFVSDRDYSSQIYLMDADGSNIVQLTKGEGDSGFDTFWESNPWSPDGKKLLFLQGSKNEQYPTLYSMDIDGENQIALTNEPGTYSDPSWSPDGNHIAFIYAESELSTRHLFVLDREGQLLVDLSESLQMEGKPLNLGPYHWSQDGASIFFTTAGYATERQFTFRVYEGRLDGSLTVVAGPTDSRIRDWWNGTVVLQADWYQGSKSLVWLHPDRSQSSLEVCPESQIGEIAHRHAHDGSLVFGSHCSTGDWTLYWANPDGTITNKLLELGIPARNASLLRMTWSPDDRFIAFIADALYVLDVARARQDPSIQPLIITGGHHPSWQPVIDNKVVDEPTPTDSPIATDIPTLPPTDSPVVTDVPTLIPTDTPTAEPIQPVISQERLIAFTAAGEDSHPDIFTMRPDGSELTNLTNDPTEDVNPFWSPDGKRIAFESVRTGLPQIFVMDADGSNVFQVADGEVPRQFPNADPWSPDGSRLIFTEMPPENENWMLYAIGVDGQNKTPLVEVPNIYTNPSWSPDGKHIAFILTNGQGDLQVNHIYVVDANGENLTDVTKLLPAEESLDYFSRYTWSEDGESISFITHGLLEEGWTTYEASLDGETLTKKTELTSPMIGGQAGTIFIPEVGMSALPSNCQETNGADTRFVTKHLVGENSLMIHLQCPSDELWFYLADPDGMTIKHGLGSPISARDGGVYGIFWSPDDKYIAVVADSSGLSYLYVIDVEASLKNPGLQHPQVTLYGGVWYFNISWQPVP